MEHNGNIVDMPAPRYALRLDELRSWHVIRVTCLHCQHEGDVRPMHLARRLPPHTLIKTLERKFRCRTCGNRFGNSWTVLKLARNT